MNLKEIEFTLPSGKKVKMRESTGLDQLAARRKFIGRDEVDKGMVVWEEISRCIIELEGVKKVDGYEKLLTLSNKDLTALLFAYNQLNTPTEEETKELVGFFGSGKISGPSPGLGISA